MKGWLERCLLHLYPQWCSDDLVWSSAPSNATDRHSDQNLGTKILINTHSWKFNFLSMCSWLHIEPLKPAADVGGERCFSKAEHIFKRILSVTTKKWFGKWVKIACWWVDLVQMDCKNYWGLVGADHTGVHFLHPLCDWPAASISRAVPALWICML